MIPPGDVVVVVPPGDVVVHVVVINSEGVVVVIMQPEGVVVVVMQPEGVVVLLPGVLMDTLQKNNINIDVNNH